MLPDQQVVIIFSALELQNELCGVWILFCLLKTTL